MVGKDFFSGRYIEMFGTFQRGVIVRVIVDFVSIQENGREVNCTYAYIFARVAPDIRPFLLSGIRPDIRFRVPNIWLEKNCLKLKTGDKYNCNKTYT